MGRPARGVIARAPGAPVEPVTVLVPDPGPGEALVRVRACGVCHTDLLYRNGAMAGEFPFLLGHEAAGVVEAVGPGVAGLAPGDAVVLAWRAPCGACRYCARGRPWLCVDSRTADQPTTLQDGTLLTPALGVGAFAERCLVAAGQAVKVDPSARPEAAGLVGCGVMTGYGAVVRTAAVEPGDTVAVFGCGGVGCAAVHAAALAGARWSWPASSAPPTPSTRAGSTRSTPSASSPAGSAPT
jgi:S-(hydroxymethyl)mycothiol dehydrogenase